MSDVLISRLANCRAIAARRMPAYDVETIDLAMAEISKLKESYALLFKALAIERERCASICAGIGAGYTGAARRLDGQHATHAAGQRDGANECAAAIRRA
jgi:hypothetical protein